MKCVEFTEIVRKEMSVLVEKGVVNKELVMTFYTDAGVRREVDRGAGKEFKGGI